MSFFAQKSRRWNAFKKLYEDGDKKVPLTWKQFVSNSYAQNRAIGQKEFTRQRILFKSSTKKYGKFTHTYKARWVNIEGEVDFGSVVEGDFSRELNIVRTKEEDKYISLMRKGIEQMENAVKKDKTDILRIKNIKKAKGDNSRSHFLKSFKPESYEVREGVIDFNTKRSTVSENQKKNAFEKKIMTDSELPWYEMIFYKNISTIEMRTVKSILKLPLFQSKLVYPTLGTKEFYTTANNDRMCGYDQINKDLGYSVEKVEELVNKKRDEGLTCEDITKVFQHAGRQCYLYDLKENCILKALDVGEYDSHKISAYIIANSHVYGLTKEAQKRILAKRGKHSMDVVCAEQKEKVYTTKNIVVGTFHEAKKLADKIVKDQCQDENKKVIIFNINTDNLFEDYINLLTQGICYGSNIYNSTITKIQYHRSQYLSIKFSANKHYTEIRQTCKDLDVKYKDQTLPTLARNLFEDLQSKSIKDSNWSKSFCSKQIQEIMDSDLSVMGGLNYGKESFGDFKGIDCYRNYASIAMEGNFYTIDIMSELQPYNEDDYIFDFMFYVETKNVMPLNGNGIYDYEIVRYCILHGIIKESDIKNKIPITKRPNNSKILKEYIENVYNKVSIDSHRKKIVNFLIGQLGKRESKCQHEAIITTNVEEAQYYQTTSTMSDKKIITLAHLDSSVEPILMVTAEDKMTMMSNDRTIFMAIVQRARLKMAILWDKLEKFKGCEPVAIHTDCIIYKGPKEPHELVDIPEVPTFGDYRKETIDYNFIEDHVNDPREAVIDCTQSRREWDIYRADPNKYFDYKKALEYSRVFISGFAGTGKSHVARALADHLESIDSNRVIRCSFTNKAALNIKGKSIHSSLGVGTSGLVFDAKITKIINDTTHIIIDEASMIPQSLYKILSQIPDSVKIYIIGDFGQFKPVEPELHPSEEYDPSKNYCDSTMFKSLCGFNQIELTKQCRADKEFAEESRAVLKGGAIPQGVKVVDKIRDSKLPNINICYTNKMRVGINNIKMTRIAKKQKIDPVKYEDRYRRPSTEFAHLTEEKKLKLKSWQLIDEFPYIYNKMPVISNKTNSLRLDGKKEIIYANNEDFKIGSFNTEKITLFNNDHRITINLLEFKKNFRPRYCITCHKSQGMTIDKPYAIHQYDQLVGKTMDEDGDMMPTSFHGQYVALTRTSDKKNITIVKN